MENQTEMFPGGEQKKLSPEEMAFRRQEMIAFYETQLPLMKLQKEYETLAADIEEARSRRVRAVIMLGQMTVPPENLANEDEDLEDESKEEGEPTARTRKLKTDKQ